MAQPRLFVLATRNAAKIAEYADIVRAHAPEWRATSPAGAEPVETGTTFAANALIKARAAHRHTRLPVLADDSGLCVDVLGGAPGVFSAYWAGQQRDPAANRALLLDQLADIADPHRGAHFASALALIEPDGTEHLAEARWPGRLARTARGDDGFPYDAIFVPDPPRGSAEPAPGAVPRSVAEWEARTRHLASHRARAFRELLPVWARLAGARAGATPPPPAR